MSVEALCNKPSLPSTASRTCSGLGKHVRTTLHCSARFFMEVALIIFLGISLSFFVSISKATNLYLLDLSKLFKIGAPVHQF